MCTNYKENEKRVGVHGPRPRAFVSRYVTSMPGLGLICDMAKLLGCLSPQLHPEAYRTGSVNPLSRGKVEAPASGDEQKTRGSPRNKTGRGESDSPGK